MSTARTIMTREVVSLAPETALAEATETLTDNRISGAPVVDGQGKLLGVVSIKDLARPGNGEPLDETDFYLRWPPAQGTIRRLTGVGEPTVADVMNAPITVEEATPLTEVARKMVERRIHRILVTDAERLVGLISSLDFVGLYAGTTPD